MSAASKMEEWEDDAVVVDPHSYSDFNADNILPQPADVLAKIRKWLQPTAYNDDDGEFARHLACHLKGTGQWVFESKAYKEWLSSETHGLLWVRGIPGSGKSVLSARLIDHLRQQGGPVLFFFFRQIIDANHSPRAAVCDWLDQILAYSPPLQLTLKQHMTEGRSVETIPALNLWKHLREALRHIPRVYVVADALDEMDRGSEMATFLDSLAQLGQGHPSQCKVITTSRPVEYVEAHLRMARALHVRLEEHLVDLDIATYVRHRLSSSAIPATHHKRIQDAVPGRANGLFLFAKLAMDEFVVPNADIQQVLLNLPADLNAMYTDLLREHARRTRVPEYVQILLMQLVTHATRPLRLLELAQVIHATQPLEQVKDLGGAKDLVRTACGPLLEILPSETVSVVHHSLTEFLTGETRMAEPHGYPVFMFGATHHRLALLCLSYIKTVSLAEFELGSRSGYTHGIGSAFTQYAGCNWFIHAKKAASVGVKQDEVNKILDTLLSGRNLQIMSLLSRKNDLPSGCTPLFAAVAFEVEDYTRILLERPQTELEFPWPQDNDPFQESGEQTPLLYASKKGYTGIVKMLLERGADVNVRDKESFSAMTPLFHAARNNHADIVTLLLEAGADPFEGTETDTHTPLHANKSDTGICFACRDGYTEVARAFLPFIRTNRQANKILYWAVEYSKPDIVEMLVKNPLCNVNAQFRAVSLLMIASANKDVKSIRCLLDAGADATVAIETSWSPSFKQGYGHNVLHCWAAKSRDTSDWGIHEHVDGLKTEPGADVEAECFRLLIKAGASVHQKDSRGNTPFHLAGSIAIAKLLLSAGADPTAVNTRGETPLHLWKDKAMTEWLLDELGRLGIPGTGSDMLLSFLEDKKIDMAFLLLGKGVDASAVGRHGMGALHHVVSMEKPYQGEDLRPRLVEELIKAGADMNLRDGQGKTPLHRYMRSSNSRGAFDDALFLSLAASGADFTAKDFDGLTPLATPFNKSYSVDHVIVGQKMIELEGNLDTKDHRGCGLLHMAAINADIKVLQWLIDHGLDPKATDYEGNNVFHHVMKQANRYPYGPHSRSYDVFEFLLQAGIDPLQPNHQGRTPLHSVSATHHYESNSSGMTRGAWRQTTCESAFEYVLGKYNTVDQRDHAGATALHLAATFSPYHTRHLLDAGADPALSTHEGMTAFHLAARNRQPNILGMLIECLDSRAGRDKTRKTLMTRAGYRTAIYYACASGVMETVQMMLDVMDDEDGEYIEDAFAGCVDFEAEQEHWLGYRKDDNTISDAGAVTLADTHRTKATSSRGSSVTRLDEIVGLLVAHKRPSRSHLDQVIDRAARQGHDYTTDCLVRARNQLCFGTPLALTHAIHACITRREAVRSCYRDGSPISAANDGRNGSDFEFLMSLREFELAGNRLVQLDRPRANERLLEHIFEGGFLSLLRPIGPRLLSQQQSQRLPEGASFGLSTPKVLSEPLLSTVCRREWPAMDLVKWLVEELGVDPNGNDGLRKASSSSTEPPGQTTALHVLASGCHWWQATLGIPYLVAHGANLEARDGLGMTPLNFAIHNAPVRRGLNRRAIETLIDLGADIDSRDDGGNSCLIRAVDDLPTFRTLLARGAHAGPGELFALIDVGNCELLEELLRRGVDPNGRSDHQTYRFHTVQMAGGGSRTCYEDSSELVYPLHHAAVGDTYRKDKQIWERMVKLLLQYGADPNARYENTNVAHQAVNRGTFAKLFLEQPSLDIEAADSDGMTFFLSACRNPFASCPDQAEAIRTKTTLVHILMERGADVYARDNKKRNALHHLLHQGVYDDRTDLLRLLAGKADLLINSPDEDGRTPIHYALGSNNFAVDHVDILLSAGADPWIAGNLGDTVLHWVFQHGTWRVKPGKDREVSCNILERLLQLPGAAARVNLRNKAGETPVFGFMRGREKSLASLTREAGADSYEPAFDVFEQAGVDWFVKNNKRQTLLHVVAQDQSRVSVARFKILLAKGLDPRAENSKNETPLDVAALNNQQGILDLFNLAGRERIVEPDGTDSDL